MDRHKSKKTELHWTGTRADFIARLAALIPRPRVNLARFHGVSALNFHWRAEITPTGRGKRRAAKKPLPAAQKHRTMTWGRRLKGVLRMPQGTFS